MEVMTGDEALSVLAIESRFSTNARTLVRGQNGKTLGLLRGVKTASVGILEYKSG